MVRKKKVDPHANDVRVWRVPEQHLKWWHNNCFDCKKLLFNTPINYKAMLMYAMKLTYTDGYIPTDVADAMGYDPFTPEPWVCKMREVD